MGSNSEGEIVQLDQARGMNKALMKMVDSIIERTENPQDRFLPFHCNAPEHAQMVKEALLKKAAFKDSVIVDTAGVSSMYANDGGIIVV